MCPGWRAAGEAEGAPRAPRRARAEQEHLQRQRSSALGGDQNREGRALPRLRNDQGLLHHGALRGASVAGAGRRREGGGPDVTDPRAGRFFQWHHTCREQPFPGEHAGHKVSLSVLHERLNGLSSATLCGTAIVPLDDVLAGCKLPSGEISVTRARTVDLTLKKNDEETGVLTIQAMLARHATYNPAQEDIPLTEVDPGMFESDVHRLGVSGGTAPFFRLALRPEAATKWGPDLSREYYIGKDLSHARDEVNFYELALQVSRQHTGGGIEGMIRFMFEYAGVHRCEVQGTGQLDLLVMRNLRDQCEELRMLDIKIGQQTADAGWQGKSRMAALRQSIIDGATNSCEEGFRLEGFDGAPPTLSSMDPLLDLYVLGEDTKFQAKLRKKALRIMYQRMPASEMIMHFIDVHQVPADPGPDKLESTLAPIELAELVLNQVVLSLARLALTCRLVITPQKWIGSSVALGFDCGCLPPRSQPEQQVREAVRVHIFDWGRSEFNTLEKHMAMSEKEQADRAQFWGYYKGGIDRLLYESTRSYYHKFGNAEGWHQARITIYDFDSMTDNDIIGKVDFAMSESQEATVQLTDSQGYKVSCGGQASTLTYAVAYRQLPRSSRLAGCWYVSIVRAAHLKACDRMQGRFSSDPFAVLEVFSKDEKQRVRQQTSVIIGNLNPEWKEVLQVPVAASPNHLEDALTKAASAFGEETGQSICAERIGPLLPPEDASRDDVEQAITGFRGRLDRASHCASTAPPPGPQRGNSTASQNIWSAGLAVNV
eukprot:CAMPEP_0204517936 /NCGR_PEP_ID=MMETSP0661-20131031/3934_1 /ASSEMBLY_ACC=CAM_ASM_000606 /TAXON_ID=109239 /ORGANISM="Alexandrium margalefi, Strain AMGDE01CS-322" /LENGTH=769 /DNA_ID=CAMNT_0051523355 /DNA_START=15 /DNA_END=2325 /DNA_ORIENTATION=-